VVGLGHQELFVLQELKGSFHQRGRSLRGQGRRWKAEGLANTAVPLDDFLPGLQIQEPAVIPVALVAKDDPVADQIAVTGRVKGFTALGTTHQTFPTNFSRLLNSTS
jgi:hypothetical protein